jgi:hypothetical protein
MEAGVEHAAAARASHRIDWHLKIGRLMGKGKPVTPEAFKSISVIKVSINVQLQSSFWWDGLVLISLGDNDE